MEEIKFDIAGEHHRSNGWKMRGELSFLAVTKEEAIATCQRLHPDFEIHTVTEDHTKPEVVRVQRFI